MFITVSGALTRSAGLFPIAAIMQNISHGIGSVSWFANVDPTLARRNECPAGRVDETCTLALATITTRLPAKHGLKAQDFSMPGSKQGLWYWAMTAGYGIRWGGSLNSAAHVSKRFFRSRD